MNNNKKTMAPLWLEYPHIIDYKFTYSIDWVVKNNKNHDYLFFWGHQPSKDGKITKSCLSQWWKSEFQEDHIKYNFMEQYMMAKKAKLFKDEEIYSKILASSDPREIKKLGRKVSHFKEDKWSSEKYSIVVLGNYMKFMQNDLLKEYLLSTGEQVIVEASPYDHVWGIGLKEGDKGITDPSNWKGKNLLGFALMEVRDIIRKTCANEKLINFDYH